MKLLRWTNIEIKNNVYSVSTFAKKNVTKVILNGEKKKTLKRKEFKNELK